MLVARKMPVGPAGTWKADKQGLLMQWICWERGEVSRTPMLWALSVR